MDFIKELHEARLTRAGGSLKTLTYTDCCERAYLTILILEVLRRFPTMAGIAHGYGKKTSDRDNYKYFRMSGTDLYNFVYFITGDDDALNKLKDPGAAKKMRDNTRFPTMAFNRYVSKLGGGYSPVLQDQTDVLNIESALKITNAEYKVCRRNIFSFEGLSTKNKKDTITRLLIAARAKLRTSDIIEHLEKLSADRDLEVYSIADNEPKVSVPDITTSGSDLIAYRYIVGTKNLMMAKKFLELAKDGKSIPSNMVQAYMPAIQLIDNIVKGGPSFIQMLRVLENRAKKASKK
jgi:hypothetical protein